MTASGTPAGPLTAPSPSFLFPLVHELMAPLRALKGFGTLLQEELTRSGTPEAGVYLRQTSQAISKLEALAEGLTKLAEAATPPDSRVPCELIALAVEQSGALQQQGWRFAVEANGKMTVVGRRSHFQLLLAELLRNAALATRHRNDATVVIRVVELGGHSTLTIEDNGAGLPGENPEICFRPFALLRSRTVWPGVGLGLFIARTILSHYGAQISLSRRPTAGTVVCCTFPKDPE